jgi:sporulation protein YabP
MADNGKALQQESAAGEHLSLDGREALRVTGVKEVLRFDPDTVVLRTGDRLLVVRGGGLALRRLSPDDGRVEIRGRVDALSFEQGGTQKSLLRRLFG